MHKETSIIFHKFTYQQEEEFRAALEKSNGEVCLFVDPLEAIEWDMEPGQLEELQRHEREIKKIIGEARMPVIIMDESWRFKRTKEELSSGLAPLYYIPDMGSELQKRTIILMQFLGINKILLGGRFMTSTGVGCVDSLGQQLQKHFVVEIKPELSAKFLG